MSMRHGIRGIPLFVAMAIATSTDQAQTPAGAADATPKYAPEVPAKITTPDGAETGIGALRFKGGAPDAMTVQLAYDQIDFARGIDAFLKGISATSVYAGCRGLEDVGSSPTRASPSPSNCSTPARCF